MVHKVFRWRNWRCGRY